MNAPILPSALLALSLSLIGCKPSYNSLSSDPQTRIQEVRNCKSSEILAQVIIYEKTPEIREIADKKLIDRNYLKQAVEAMSEKEMAKLAVEDPSGAMQAIYVKYINDENLLVDIAAATDNQFTLDACVQKIKSDENLYRLLGMPGSKNRSNIRRDMIKKELRLRMLMDPSFLYIDDYAYSSGMFEEMSLSEIAEVILKSSNPKSQLLTLSYWQKQFIYISVRSEEYAKTTKLLQSVVAEIKTRPAMDEHMPKVIAECEKWVAIKAKELAKDEQMYKEFDRK